jgi:glycosyltransferase involved in cell wall biosynthesis
LINQKKSIENIYSNFPTISCIMSVYNGEMFLNKAIDSILNQTFNDFEFIIINDNSTDSSRDIILSYNDSRIKFINNEINLGLTKSLNNGLNIAKGKFIARMDADDYSLPDRFEESLRLMSIGYKIVSLSAITNDGNRVGQIWNQKCMKYILLTYNPIVHSAVMFTSDIRYDESYRYAQDFELWSRFRMSVYKSEKVGVIFNKHQNQLSNKNRFEQLNNVKLIIKRNLTSINLFPTESQLNDLVKMRDNSKDDVQFYKTFKWLFISLLKHYPHELFTLLNYITIVKKGKKISFFKLLTCSKI